VCQNKRKEICKSPTDGVVIPKNPKEVDPQAVRAGSPVIALILQSRANLFERERAIELGETYAT
jgi:hypothetical protein